MKNKPETQAIITPYVTYATIDQLNNEATTRANQDALLNTSINLLTTDYQSFKSTTNTTLNNKQNKTDNTLTTNDKTVVGAINELKSTTDNQTASITQNTVDIQYIEDNYLQSADIDQKQDITDDNLETTDKTVVGAINELKSVNDTQDTNITNLQTQVVTNTNNIGQNTSDIEYIEQNYVQSADIDGKQDITDDNLETTDKTVVGAINELNTINDNQNSSINQNSSDIATLQSSMSDTSAALDLKQDKTDNGLNTTDKTVVGAINELKSVNDTQDTNITNLETEVTNNTNNITTLQTQVATNTNDISQNTSDIATLQSSMSDTDAALNLKQDKTDNGLNTIDKTVVGAINELKSDNDTQDTNITNLQTQVATNTSNISQNTSDIATLQSSMSDTSAALNLKQDKTDNGLNTTDKTVVGAINELKSDNDVQDTNITNLQTQVTTNTNNISQNTSDIATLQSSMSDTDAALDLKQDITDDNLTTTDQTVVGAINELNTNKVNNTDFNSFQDTVIQYQTITNNVLNDKQDKIDGGLTTSDISVVGAINELKLITDNQSTTIASHTTTINNLPSTYMTITNANNALALKQNITENSLTTTSKTIPGAINELKGVNDTQNTNITNNTNVISSLPSTYITIANANSALALKQNITDNSLNTTSKTVPGAINELKASISTWTAVGTSTNARTWTYNLVINKRYRVALNWGANDTTSKVYREFVWTGNNTSVEQYMDGFNGVTILGITVLGSANLVEVIASATGITINNRLGSSTLGRVVSLEEASL